MVRGRHGSNTPVPGLAVIQIGLKGEGRVGHVKPSVVPRCVGEAVHGGKVTLGVELDDVASQCHRSSETPIQHGLGDRGEVDPRPNGPRTVEWKGRGRVGRQRIRAWNVNEGKLWTAGHGIFGRAEVRRPRTPRACAEHAGDEVNASVLTHGVLNRQRDVPLHGVALGEGISNRDAIEERTALGAFGTGRGPGVGTVVARPGGILRTPVVLVTLPNADGGRPEGGGGQRHGKVSRLHRITVGQQVRDEVTTHQSRDFTAERAVIDGHLRIAVIVVVGGCAVDVGVHALGVLVVLRAVAVLQAEFIPVPAQPRALKRRHEETRSDPFAVVTISVDRRHSPEVHVANFKGLGAGHGEGPVGRAEVVVNTGIDSHFAESEVFVRGQLKENVVPGGGLRPVQRGLGVAREVVAGLVPDGQAFSGGREAHGRRWRTGAPFVGDGERWRIAWIAGFSGVEEDAFVVGVGLEFPTNSDHQVERILVPTVEVILNGVVEVKGETVAGLAPVSEGHRRRAV